MTPHLPALDPGEYRGPSPPPDAPPVHGERHWIDTPADLVEAARALADFPVLAVDVEFVSARPTDLSQTPRLALIQIAGGTPMQCFVIDTLRIVDLAALNVPFEREGILKIFHGVGSDVRVLAVRGVQVRHTLDIEAVSRSLFGSRESSLQAMLQRACDIRMDKSLQRSDWTQRPLATAMLAYAARDAEMTMALAQWLQRHFAWATDLYEERPGDPTPEDLIAPWLAAYIQGDRSVLPDMTEPVDHQALARDCYTALEVLQRPTWRARTLRAASDLVLTEVIPLAEAALQARMAEERSAGARALGKLRATDARVALTAALDDPVFDVRKAVVAAFEQLDLPPRNGRFARHATPPEAAPDEAELAAETDAPWKAALRGLLPDDEA